jgi:hypothetical protein
MKVFREKAFRWIKKLKRFCNSEAVCCNWAGRNWKLQIPLRSKEGPTAARCPNWVIISHSKQGITDFSIRVLVDNNSWRLRWLTVIGENLEDDQGQILEYWWVKKADSVIILPIQGDRLLIKLKKRSPGAMKTTIL